MTAGDAGDEVPAASVFTPVFIDALEYGWADLNGDGYVSGTELGIYLQEKVPHPGLWIRNNGRRFQRGKKKHVRIHLSPAQEPLFKTTAWWVWTGETKDSANAWIFYFSGGYGYWLDRKTSSNLRAFAVRTGTIEMKSPKDAVREHQREKPPKAIEPPVQEQYKKRPRWTTIVRLKLMRGLRA